MEWRLSCKAKVIALIEHIDIYHASLFLSLIFVIFFFFFFFFSFFFFFEGGGGGGVVVVVFEMWTGELFIWN